MSTPPDKPLPELPPGLPTPTRVPHGFARWEYRGLGFIKAHGNFSVYREGGEFVWTALAVAVGTPDLHYLEAVRDEAPASAGSPDDEERSSILPPDWDELHPRLADQWQQVSHELAEMILRHDVELNRTDAMRHYHAVYRRQNIAEIKAQIAVIEKREAQPAAPGATPETDEILAAIPSPPLTYHVQALGGKARDLERSRDSKQREIDSWKQRAEAAERDRDVANSASRVAIGHMQDIKRKLEAAERRAADAEAALNRAKAAMTCYLSVENPFPEGTLEHDIVEARYDVAMAISGRSYAEDAVARLKEALAAKEQPTPPHRVETENTPCPHCQSNEVAKWSQGAWRCPECWQDITEKP